MALFESLGCFKGVLEVARKSSEGRSVGFPSHRPCNDLKSAKISEITHVNQSLILIDQDGFVALQFLCDLSDFGDLIAQKCW